MNEEMGLAQQAGGQQEQAQMMQMVQEVAQALMQGATPEQLMQQGVPAEVIQAAMEMVQAQTAAPQPVDSDAGLAMQMNSEGVM